MFRFPAVPVVLLGQQNCRYTRFRQYTSLRYTQLIADSYRPRRQVLYTIVIYESVCFFMLLFYSSLYLIVRIVCMKMVAGNVSFAVIHEPLYAMVHI